MARDLPTHKLFLDTLDSKPAAAPTAQQPNPEAYGCSESDRNRLARRCR